MRNADPVRGRPAPARASASAERVVRNSVLNLSTQVLFGLLQVVTVMALAKTLGRAGLGEFYTFFSLILAVQLFLEVGLGTVLTRRITSEPSAWVERVSETNGFAAIVVAASFAVLLAFGGLQAWYRGDPARLAQFAVAGVTCAAIQVQRLTAGVFRAFERFGPENAARVLQAATFTGLLLVTTAAGRPGLFVAQVLFAVSHVLAAAVLVGGLVRVRRGRWFAWRLDARVVKDWMSEAIPLGLGDVLRGWTWQLDTILLGWLKRPEVVGIYSVAYRPLGPLNLLPQAILTAAFASFVKMAEGDRDALNLAFVTSTRLVWLISLPLAIVICIDAEAIVVMLAGPSFREAMVPMRVLIWVACLSFLSFQFRFLFAALGRQREYIRLVGLVLVFEAVVEVCLIPRWGYFGACAGSVLGELVFTVAGLALCRQFGIGKGVGRALARPVVAGVVMAALLWNFRGASFPVLAVSGLACGGVYVAVCLGVGALSWSEVLVLLGTGERLFGSVVGTARTHGASPKPGPTDAPPSMRDGPD